MRLKKDGMRKLIHPKERLTQLARRGDSREFINFAREYRVKKGHVLAIAAQHGNAELIRRLEKLGSDLETQFSNGLTLIHYAILGNNLDTLEELLKKRTNDEPLLDPRGNSLLHYIAQFWREEKPYYLVKDYRVINRRNYQGETPLYTLLRSTEGILNDEEKRILKDLVHSGASPFYMNSEGRNAFSYVSSYNTEIMEILLKIVK